MLLCNEIQMFIYVLSLSPPAGIRACTQRFAGRATVICEM